jgi:prepilin-type N-terminal cleavage/methylation domain-containing protein
MSTRRLPGYSSGFTLIEIVAALAILSTGMMVLVESHYNGMSLFATARDEAEMQRFLQSAVDRSEAEVLTGKLTGEGDFGKRHEDYTYRFVASRPDEEIPLYHVEVTVTGPADESTVEFRIFSVAKDE